MTKPLFAHTVRDLRGHVASGASVEIRDQSTGALVDLFEPGDENTPKDNPVEADAYGWVAARLDTDRTVKITITHRGTSRVVQHVDARGGSGFGFLNVRDYGAIGDGSAIDTVAVQAAIDAASAYPSSSQPVIYFPPGTYLTDTLTATTGLLFMGGDPGGVTIRHVDGTSGPLISTTVGGGGGGPTPALPYEGFINLRLRAGTMTTAILYFDGNIDNGVKFENLSFDGTVSTVECDGISATDYLNFGIDKVRWDGITGYAIKARAASDFSSCYVNVTNWTYDIGTGTTGRRGMGLFFADISGLTSGFKGSVRFQGGRLELNDPLDSSAKGLIRVVQDTTYTASNGAQVAIGIIGCSFIADSSEQNTYNTPIISVNSKDVALEIASSSFSYFNELVKSDGDDLLNIIPLPPSPITKIGHYASSGLSSIGPNAGLWSGTDFARRFSVQSDAALTGQVSAIRTGDIIDYAKPWNVSGRAKGLRPFALKAVQDFDGAATIETRTLSGTGGISASSTTLAMSTTLDNTVFPGAAIVIPGAGPAGADLTTRATAVDYDNDEITVADAASTTVAGATITRASAVYAYVNMVFPGSNAPPTTGTYQQGDRCLNVDFGSGKPVAEWICVTAGTPGNWRCTSWRVEKGTTASRPSLSGLPAAGVGYLDTDLATDGMPITWNGSKWVDARGKTPSSDAFPDYETGTWTPVLRGASTAGSHTYAVQSGRYIKVGRMVVAHFYIDISSVDGAMSGNLELSGLPFASFNNTGHRTAVAFSYVNHFNFASMLVGRVINNVSHARLESVTAGTSGGTASLTDSDVGTNPVLQGTITYEAAS